MATTDISICSAALLMIGENSISTLTGENLTRPQSVCKALYPDTRDTLLASHTWNFCKTQASLARLTSEPLFKEYKYAFQLPTGFLRLIRVERGKDFKLYERYLYSNSPEVNVEYTFRPPESRFPSYIVTGLQLKMASVLALAIAEDGAKSERFDKKFEREMVMARAIDNQSKPTSSIDSSMLINVRY